MQVSGVVQSSTQSLLLEEQECLTGAREAQGSIIDLTSQSCRALSPSFTPPACQPHTSALMCTQTHTQTHNCMHYTQRARTQRCLMYAVCPLILSFSVFQSHTHTYTRAHVHAHTHTTLVSQLTHSTSSHTILAALKS